MPPAIGCMSLMFASDVLAQSSCTIYGVDGRGLGLSRQSGASDRVGAFRSGSVRPDFQKGNLRSPCLLWSKHTVQGCQRTHLCHSHIRCAMTCARVRRRTPATLTRLTRCGACSDTQR